MPTRVLRHAIGVFAAGVALLAVASSALAAQGAPPTDAQLTDRVDEYMMRLENLGYTGGVLVVRNRRVVLERSYGMANRAAGVVADTATVYNLGSITKQFTAAAILRLEELGKLRTTDSIARFFPDAPADKRAITLHQLLTHTAGFNSDYSPSDYEVTSRDEYVRRMFAAPLRTPPGSTHFYANAGYSMLAAIVEVVTGHVYETALRELVLEPAGMRETGYKAPGWPSARIAHGYQNGRDWGTIVDRIAPSDAPYWALRGNGGLHTTLSDMARWDAALNDARVLTDSSRRKFMTGYVNEGPEGDSQYAYGWAVMKTRRGTRLVTHNGGNGVYVAEFLRFVDDSVTIFATSTVSELTATPVVRVLTRIAFGEPYELPPERLTASARVLADVAGTYRLADSSRLTLRVVNGRLMAEAIGQQAYALLATGDTTSPPGAAEANARARLIVEALVAGNVGPLLAARGEGGPDSAEVARQEAQLMAGRRERLGDFQSIDVIGSLRGPEGGLRTTVRLNFARGGATNIYTFNRSRRIEDLGARPYSAVELILTGGGEFLTFDLRGGTTVRLRFVDGSAIAATPSGPITLRRE
ncbi:MAG TPA: serine hydrolase domain-containing protein [Gemmatimonadaceae bacterium]|jgi:CubicO group peptidase (beta-lactamase class C family)